MTYIIVICLSALATTIATACCRAKGNCRYAVTLYNCNGQIIKQWPCATDILSTSAGWRFINTETNQRILVSGIVTLEEK